MFIMNPEKQIALFSNDLGIVTHYTQVLSPQYKVVGVAQTITEVRQLASQLDSDHVSVAVVAAREAIGGDQVGKEYCRTVREGSRNATIFARYNCRPIPEAGYNLLRNSPDQEFLDQLTFIYMFSFLYVH